MKKIKLVTGLAALATVGTTLGTLASCAKSSEESKSKIVIDGCNYDPTKTTIKLNETAFIYLVPRSGTTITGIDYVKVGGKAISDSKYSLKDINGSATHELIIHSSVMTSLSISISVKYEKIPTTVDVDHISDVTYNGSTVQNGVARWYDFTVNVVKTDGTTGTVVVGETCKVFSGETDITSDLASAEGYTITTYGDWNLTLKAGANFDKEFAKTISISKAKVLSSLKVTRTSTETLTTEGAVKASDFEVKGVYDDQSESSALEWSVDYVVYDANGVVVPKFDEDGYTLASGSNTLTFKYKQNEEITSGAVTLTASDVTDSCSVSSVAITTHFDHTNKKIVIGATDPVKTPITNVVIKKGSTTLTKDTHYTISDDFTTITLLSAGMSFLGNIVITPTTKELQALSITNSITDPLTTSALIKSSQFTVVGVYKDSTKTAALTCSTQYKVLYDTTDITTSFAGSGYALTSGSHTLTFKYANDETIFSTASLTVADTTVSIDSSASDDVELTSATTATTITIDVKSGSSVAIKGITSVVKGSTTLIENTDYTVSADFKTITLQSSALTVLGNVVVTPNVTAYYTIDNKGLVTMTAEGKALTGTVTIPTKVKGTIVKGIADSGCAGDTKSQATEIQFQTPANITTIGQYAFMQCPNLTTITIPAGVTEIGQEAFKKCTALDKVTFPSDSTLVGFRGGVFNGCTNLGKTDGTIKLPDSLNSLGTLPFWGCTSLKTIDLSNTQVATVTYLAFQNCTSLETVKLPSTLTKIVASAFGGCTNLQSYGTVTFGDTTANKWIQNNGSSYLDVSVPRTNAINLTNTSGTQTVPTGTNWGATGILQQELKTITVTSDHDIEYGDTINMKLYDSAHELISTSATFTYASGTTSEIVKAEAVSGSSGLYNITALKQGSETIYITIPGYAVQSYEVEVGSFDGLTFSTDTVTKCETTKTSIYVPSRYYDKTYQNWQTVTAIQAEAFKDQTTITNVAFPSTLTSIQAKAFSGCTGLSTSTATATFASTSGWVQSNGGQKYLDVSSDTAQNAANLVDCEGETPTGTNWGGTGLTNQSMSMITGFDISDVESQNILQNITTGTKISSNPGTYVLTTQMSDGAPSLTGKFKFEVTSPTTTEEIEFETESKTIPLYSSTPLTFTIDFQTIFQGMSNQSIANAIVTMTFISD